MNGFALDTNIISFHLKGNETVRRNVGQKLDAKTQILVPPFAYYEVKRGLLDAKATTQLRLFDKLLKDCRLGDATNAVFEAAVNIHVALKSKGRICDDMDILIAANGNCVSACQTYGLTLVTNNTRHFENIPGLALADWSAAVEG
jgi:predicted nucleic acid-binding protein